MHCSKSEIHVLVQIEGCKELSGISLTVQGRHLNSTIVLEKLIDKITQAIKSRFSDLNDVQFTEVSNFSNWPVVLKGNYKNILDISSSYFK